MTCNLVQAVLYPAAPWYSVQDFEVDGASVFIPVVDCGEVLVEHSVVLGITPLPDKFILIIPSLYQSVRHVQRWLFKVFDGSRGNVAAILKQVG